MHISNEIKVIEWPSRTDVYCYSDNYLHLVMVLSLEWYYLLDICDVKDKILQTRPGQDYEKVILVAKTFSMFDEWKWKNY